MAQVAVLKHTLFGLNVTVHYRRDLPLKSCVFCLLECRNISLNVLFALLSFELAQVFDFEL